MSLKPTTSTNTYGPGIVRKSVTRAVGAQPVKPTMSGGHLGVSIFRAADGAPALPQISGSGMSGAQGPNTSPNLTHEWVALVLRGSDKPRASDNSVAAPLEQKEKEARRPVAWAESGEGTPPFGNDSVLDIEDHSDTLAKILAAENLLDHPERFQEAEAILRAAIKELTRDLERDHHPHISLARRALAISLKLQALQDEKSGNTDASSLKYLEARDILSAVALTYTERLGAEDRKTLAITGDIVDILFEQGNVSEAAKMQEEIVTTLARVYGHDHLDTLMAAVRWYRYLKAGE